MTKHDVIDEAAELGRRLLEASFYLFKKVRGADSFTQIRIKDINVLRGSSMTSNLARATLEYTLMGDERTYKERFLIKYPAPLPSNLPPGYHSHRDLGYETYKFLGGIDGVPVLISKNNLRGLVALQDVGRTTAEEKMERCEQRKDRKDLVLDICSAITNFQIEASKKLVENLMSGSITPSKVNRLFGEMSMTDRAIDYVRAIRGLDSVEQLPDSLKQEIARLYPVISEAYEPSKTSKKTVCHGDITLTNIVIDDEGNYHLIDAKPKFRGPIIDVSELLSCAGVRLGQEDWEYVAEKFMISHTQTTKLEAGIRSRLRKGRTRWMERFTSVFSGSSPSIFLDKNEQMTINRILYKLIAHYSFKRLAKVADDRRFFPERYEHRCRTSSCYRNSDNNMRNNISTSLDMLINDSRRLGVEEEEVKDLERMKTFFENEGILLGKVQSLAS